MANTIKTNKKRRMAGKREEGYSLGWGGRTRDLIPGRMEEIANAARLSGVYGCWCVPGPGGGGVFEGVGRAR